MCSSSPPPAPPPPDPAATAAAQAAANKETAIASQELAMIDQVTPFGNLFFEQIGETQEGTPRYQATQTLAPEQQRLLDLANEAGELYGVTALDQLTGVSGALSDPLDFSSLGAIPTADEGTRTAVSNAIMGRMNPQIDRDRERLESQLVAKGIPFNSEAYVQAMDDFDRRVTDMRLAADIQAGNEMSRDFGLDMASRDVAARELVEGRAQPLRELAAMLTGAQVETPQFVSTPAAQVAPTDVIGATYGSANLAQNNYQAGLTNQAANNAGLYGLLGTGAMAAAMAFSDVRLKRDISVVGAIRGLGVYEYRYLWDWPLRRRMGLLAHEVRRVIPRAVHRIGRFDAVDYAEVRKWLTA